MRFPMHMSSRRTEKFEIMKSKSFFQEINKSEKNQIKIIILRSYPTMTYPPSSA